MSGVSPSIGEGRRREKTKKEVKEVKILIKTPI